MASIDQRPDGQWRARWREYPRGPQLARHFDRKRDAEDFLAQVRVDIARGAYLSPEQQRVTFGAYVEAHLGRQVWRPRTVDIARRMLEHWLEILGADRPLSAIRRGDVERGIVRMTATMAPSTVRVHFQHLRTLMRAAMADQLITVDPTFKIRLPARPAGELQIPTPELVRGFLEHAPDGFRAAIILGAYVGLRAGEAQGLLISDVDFLRRTVNVRRQLISQPAPHLVDPKTRASVRSVPVPPMVLEDLGRHIEAFGPGPGGVLLHQRGGYMHSNAFNWLWRSTQRSAGVTGTPWRFHSLRHAFASALISAGCSVKAVADAMGHESPTTTLATYAQLWPGDEDRIRSAIASAWFFEDFLRTEQPQSGR